MELSSPAFTNNNPIPDTYTCKGSGISPPLNIAGVPHGTQSLALFVHDPDAPGGDFIHWTVWNISPTTTVIAEGSKPSDATEGQNDFGKTGWGAPCPPSGTHRYFFELYALDQTSALASGASSADVRAFLEAHTLSKATLMGTAAA
jgi:Raf kinase inhibitor-like YbhB/YbcL family protein